LLRPGSPGRKQVTIPSSDTRYEHTSLPCLSQPTKFLPGIPKLGRCVYIRNVSKLVIFCVVTLAFSAPVFSQQGASPTPALPQAGIVLPRETCIVHPDQTYALYLPSHYTPGKKWPVVYAFDPAARGNQPVELMKDAAERYGYVVVGSNNSHNGSWKVEAEAAQAMLDDTHARLSLDEKRIYFAGFSGGARVAAQIALRCKCAAGVLLNGAGFPVGTSPSRESVFAVFTAVGTFDFNYPEVTRLNETLEQFGFPHALGYFEGPHQWAPATVMDQALAWFRLMAMKQSVEPRDDKFIAQQHDAALGRAHSLEQSADLYLAWREYRQSAATFDQLADITPFRQAVASLASHKAVREGAKRQKQDFAEQDNLTNDISAGLVSLRQLSANLANNLNDTRQKIIKLREAVIYEKRPDKARVKRRAIAGILVEAMEAGNDRLEAKDLTLAKDYFELATDADPDSPWALNSLATARALGNDRKGALEALRQAKAKAKNPETFSTWLQGEPAFAKFRDDPQFRSLLIGP
jgi:predicted esterase